MSTPDPRAEEVALALSRVHLALAEADTDDAVLRAAALVLAAYGPSVIRLYTLFGADVPVSAELASLWLAGVCPTEDPLLGRRFDLADHPVLARWQAAPRRPLVLHDLTADPRPGAHAEGRSAQALVVQPLHDAEAGWLGALVFSWPIVHIPNPRERLVYDLLARALTAALAGRQALRAHQQALDEANTLYVANAALAEAVGLDEILAALAEPAQAAGAAWAALWLPEGEQLVRRAPAAEPPPARPLAGAAALFARSNDPCLFDHVAEDMLDADARAAGVQAALLLPLAWQGHRAGLLELGWVEPRALPRELQRLYAAVAGRAAVLLAGRVLLAEAARWLAAGAAADELSFPVLVSEGPAPPRGNAEAARVLALAGDELHAVVHDALAVGERTRRELEVRVDGTPLWIEVLAEGGVAVLQDITAHKRADRERLLARGELIRRQSVLLSRRALPAIPLSDEVTLLQLPGPLDAARARQLAEVAASIPTSVQAVILDVAAALPLDLATLTELGAVAHALQSRAIRPVVSGTLLDPEAQLASFRNLTDALAATLFAPRI